MRGRRLSQSMVSWWPPARGTTPPSPSIQPTVVTLVVLAQGVGSFALSEDGQRLAWAEPWKGPSGDAAETTRLVEVEFPSGQVIHSTTFLGFDLLDTGDPPGVSPTWSHTWATTCLS